LKDGGGGRGSSRCDVVAGQTIYANILEDVKGRPGNKNLQHYARIAGHGAGVKENWHRERTIKGFSEKKIPEAPCAKSRSGGNQNSPEDYVQLANDGTWCGFSPF
jgi:hypothetical protein